MQGETGALFVHEGTGAGGYTLMFQCVLMPDLDSFIVMMPPTRVSELERYRLNTEARRMGYAFHEGKIDPARDINFVAVLPPHWNWEVVIDAVDEACGFDNRMRGIE